MEELRRLNHTDCLTNSRGELFDLEGVAIPPVKQVATGFVYRVEVNGVEILLDSRVEVLRAFGDGADLEQDYANRHKARTDLKNLIKKEKGLAKGLSDLDKLKKMIGKQQQEMIEASTSLGVSKSILVEFIRENYPCILLTMGEDLC